MEPAALAVKNPDNAGNQRREGSYGNPKEFHKLQIEQLLKLLNQSQNTSNNIPSCTIAQKGTFVNALNAKSCHPWIIDPGAIDHMTGNSSLFATYSPRPGNFKDPHSGKTIDNVKEHEGLYMFEDEISICGQARVGSLDVFNTKDDEIMLWHLSDLLGLPKYQP
ncbi:hypothetical protein CK203_105233 [Vitis vinifera]|uniref:Uncharacterized protein n=1 Tax=Vitis vinifera TaxID=29760 RepID=A0A438C5B7_VITVI|nr:hypothetical protein CK203_105233 [Vitis vinifera]